MSTPSQPRTGVHPAHEFVPQNRFYPRTEVQEVDITEDGYRQAA